MATRASALASRGIDDLAVAIGGIVTTDAVAGVPAIDTARHVANRLAPALRDPDLVDIDALPTDQDCYCQTILHSDPAGAFSIVALVWLPGQRTPIHDHVSWCVVGVYRGAEESHLYRLTEDDRALVRTGHMVDSEGTTSYFAPPGDIHEVANASDQKVVSIHVYGADVAVLGSSIRRRYDLPVLG